MGGLLPPCRLDRRKYAKGRTVSDKETKQIIDASHCCSRLDAPKGTVL
jgi:hypothetical protein